MRQKGRRLSLICNTFSKIKNTYQREEIEESSRCVSVSFGQGSSACLNQKQRSMEELYY